MDKGPPYTREEVAAFGEAEARVTDKDFLGGGLKIEHSRAVSQILGPRNDFGVPDYRKLGIRIFRVSESRMFRIELCSEKDQSTPPLQLIAGGRTLNERHRGIA